MKIYQTKILLTIAAVAIAIPALTSNLRAAAYVSEEYGFTATFPYKVSVKDIPMPMGVRDRSIMSSDNGDESGVGVVAIKMPGDWNKFMTDNKIDRGVALESMVRGALRNTGSDNKDIVIAPATFKGRNALGFATHSVFEGTSLIVQGIAFFDR